MSDSDPKPEQSDLTIGDWVYDQDDTDADPDIAVVVNAPSVPAHDWEVPVPDSKTLAEDNPKYPEDAPTVVVVYRDELREARSEWRERTKPYPLGEVGRGWNIVLCVSSWAIKANL